MNLLLILAAVIPAAVLLIQVYRADRLEKEPPGLLLSLVLCGVIATAISSLLEQAGVWLLDRLLLSGREGWSWGQSWRAEDPALSGGADLYHFLLFFVVVAMTEEGSKYLLLRLRTWRSPHFNCSFDGVVYAVFLSLGFALWENIQYVRLFGFATALLRAVTAVPGHACFGVFMGTWYGSAKRWSLEGREGRSHASRWLAFWIPVLLHGLYDSIAVSPTENLGWVFLGFILLLFLASAALVRRMARNDRYL